MNPLDIAVSGIVGMTSFDGHAAEALHFFLYDSVKVFALLIGIVFLVSYVRTYLAPDRVRRILARKGSHGLAALIGVVTPFCSCSAVPLFIGLLEAGVPLGVTFSYLIAAPMVNEVAVVLLLGLLGWKLALLYVGTGVLLAIIAGMILGRMQLERHVENDVWETHVRFKRSKRLTRRERMRDAWSRTTSTLRKTWLYVLIGIALGALLHGYAPQDLLSTLSAHAGWFAVPVAVIIGVPLYGNAASTIPIVRSLIEKGLPVGTALAFMMSVTALSLPEMILLRRVLKPRLLAIYVGIVTAGIILVGYLFNAVL
jgi:uncharacterized membrane protein YraQ (UPF0718 family)